MTDSKATLFFFFGHLPLPSRVLGSNTSSAHLLAKIWRQLSNTLSGWLPPEWSSEGKRGRLPTDPGRGAVEIKRGTSERRPQPSPPKSQFRLPGAPHPGKRAERPRSFPSRRWTRRAPSAAGGRGARGAGATESPELPGEEEAGGRSKPGNSPSFFHMAR